MGISVSDVLWQHLMHLNNNRQQEEGLETYLSLPHYYAVSGLTYVGHHPTDSPYVACRVDVCESGRRTLMGEEGLRVFLQHRSEM